ncbi:MAG: SAM-dependent methyltransferase [Planctomycetaceae bacterium]|jgi:methylase of polypeptide subunit release factors|nr:SAM-dependent methyltransferase [Planctomycetaceae bacterium]
MASLTKNYSRVKLTGQVYTPDFIVRKILDDVHYDSSDILGKTILDPACGDGRFLVEIAKRILQFSSKADLKQNLENVYGWDIDDAAIKKCRKNLNNLLQDRIGINWNISVTDSLKQYQKTDSSSFNKRVPAFDYIAGNPPYIRIQHLDIEQRQYIQNNYSFCQSGSTDIYIAFYELCLNLLSANGVCGLITPNTFLSTEAARSMRQYFAGNKILRQLTNYGDVQLFDNATTYSAITIFDRNAHSGFVYQKSAGFQTFAIRTVHFDELREPFWQMTAEKAKPFNGKKLKDVCEIHTGITTLCDSAYIFPVCPLDNDFVSAETKLKGQVQIERAVLKPIIKGSRLKHSEQKIDEYILFPYKKINGRHCIIPEDKLKTLYPLAYQYLLSVKDELDKRDNGKPNPVVWYAFGRSQGLNTGFGEKIIFSPMNSKPNFVYYDNPECTFYSGYCIKFSGDMTKLLSQLNSERMAEFISMSSRNFRGGWKAYNKKIVENFEVKL